MRRGEEQQRQQGGDGRAPRHARRAVVMPHDSAVRPLAYGTCLGRVVDVSRT